MVFRVVFFLCTLACQGLFSSSPASISFLVADLKYSQEHGVKICEVQHGILSTFYGNTYVNDGVCLIARNYCEALSRLNKPIWTVAKDIASNPICEIAKKTPNWNIIGNFDEAASNKGFLNAARKPVYDHSRVDNYHAILFIKLSLIKDKDLFQSQYPGVLVIDLPSYFCWIDKYEMSLLFNKDPVLKRFKPKWGLFTKHYTPDLANAIIDQLECEVFVIKPRGEFLGKGVIIVDKDHLDQTLRYIFGGSKKLKNDPDRSYQHWYHETRDTFIVEEFVSSDPIIVPHLRNEHYDPTMRVAVLVVRDEGQTNVEFLGCNWFLPKLSLEQEGSLNQKHKGASAAPYFCPVAMEIQEKIKPQLEILFSRFLID